MMENVYQILRIAAVIGLVVFAAALSTPKGRVPLALRGVLKIVRKDHDLPATDVRVDSAVPGWKKLLAFLLTLLAILLALLG